IIVAVRVLGLSRSQVGLQLGHWPTQLAIALVGLPLGATEYLILRPAPVVPDLNSRDVVLAGLILLVCTGFLEEVLFRGVLQATARQVLGGAWGMVFVSALFAVLHIGHLSAVDVVFVFAVGLAFAWLVAWSGSVLGVTLAHGLTNILLYLFMPLVVAPALLAAPASAEQPPEVTPVPVPIAVLAPAERDEAQAEVALGAQSTVTPEPSKTGERSVVTMLEERAGGEWRGWPDQPGSTAWQADGVYHLRAQRPGEFVAVRAPLLESFEDMIVTASFRKVGGPAGGGYGIIVRDQDGESRNGLSQTGHYYVLAAGDIGQVGIWRREGDRWVSLLDWTDSDAVRPGSASNELTVRASGDHLTFAVNGTEVASVADSTLRTARVGVFAGGDDNDVVLERFQVQAVR
ncbi:MAG: CPBP family intramembrane metalloprotease, partial [Chloroflexota bacterium]|nr:CPBP family intramembrane metalloprotease [Chloroflexota bacterium]